MTAFALIGCGVIGPRLAAGVAEVEDAELVACVDVVPENAEEVAAEYGGEAYTDHEEMLAEEEPDAAIVATPSGTHSAITIDCAEAGTNVLCQKPLDVRIERVDRMIAACDDAGVTLGGVFPARPQAASTRAREILADGDLGEIVLSNAFVPKHRDQAYYDSGEWRGTREMDGGCLMNQGIHYIDYAAWLNGGIERVYAQTETAAHEMEMEDVATVNVRYGNGAQGVVQVTTAAYPEREAGVEVQGVAGRLAMRGTSLDWRIEDAETVDGDLEGAGTDDLSAFGLCIADFAAALAEGRAPMVPPDEARHAIDAILAMYASAERDEPVDVAAFLERTRA